jgi:predicted transcriptional regulator
LTLCIGKPIILLMDIQQKVKEILDSGLTQTEVADIVKCSQATISDLATGKQTTTELHLGLRIIELHKERTRKNGKRKSPGRRSADQKLGRREVIINPEIK